MHCERRIFYKLPPFTKKTAKRKSNYDTTIFPSSMDNDETAQAVHRNVHCGNSHKRSNGNGSIYFAVH